MKKPEQIKQKISELENQKDQLFRLTAHKSDSNLLKSHTEATVLLQQKIDLLNWVLKN